MKLLRPYCGSQLAETFSDDQQIDDYVSLQLRDIGRHSMNQPRIGSRQLLAEFTQGRVECSDAFPLIVSVGYADKSNGFLGNIQLIHWGHFFFQPYFVVCWLR